MSSREDLLLESIKKYYQDNPESTQHLYDILVSGNISLRNLERFVMDAKKTNLSYPTKDGNTFAVHVSYKSSLDGYSKKLFDPFCRTTRFMYDIPGKEKTIETTIAQLNFIKWCITNGIIEKIMT